MKKTSVFIGILAFLLAGVAMGMAGDNTSPIKEKAGAMNPAVILQQMSLKPNNNAIFGNAVKQEIFKTASIKFNY